MQEQITYPISVKEMRERYLKLYSGAVNDVMRFNYKVNAALPSSYLPLREKMKLCGQAFTIKGAPDITTDGEFEMRATGIEEAKNKKAEPRGNIYNLQGQRISSLQKGLNIMNGQKIYVK